MAHTLGKYHLFDGIGVMLNFEATMRMGTREHIMRHEIKIGLIRIHIESLMPLTNIKNKYQKSNMLTTIEIDKTCMATWINSINLLLLKNKKRCLIKVIMCLMKCLLDRT